MKEDIDRAIKNIEKDIELSKEGEGFYTEVLCDKEDLENLLTRYKEMQLTDKEKEVIEAYRNLIKYTGSNSWVICDPKQMWSNYFIPKSKVKEKIEELENKIKPKQEVHQKLCKEIDKIGTETQYDYAMEELSILDDELREMLIEKRVLQELLREE